MAHSRHTANALTGMSWMVLNTVASRAIVLVSQVILGFVLSPGDFGLYALALSIAALTTLIRNGGTSQVLVQRGAAYAKFLSPVTQYSLIFNLLAFALLVATAPAIMASSKAQGTAALVAAIGLSFPLGTLANVYRSQLAVLGKFKELAVLSTVSTVLWQVEVIVLAFMGFGPYSFAIPMIVQALVDTLFGWFYVRSWPLGLPLITWAQFVELFRETRWIMLGAAMYSLSMTGQYFAAGMFTDAATVGIFFFGFQLANTVFVLINNAIEAVLPATLAELNADPGAQSRSVMDMYGMLMIVSLPLAGALMVGAFPAVHWLWSGKWDASATVIAIMAASLPAWFIVAVVRAALEARGLWLSRFWLLAVYGIGTVVSVGAAAVTNNVDIIASALTAFYLVFGVISLLWLKALAGVSYGEILGPVARPLCATSGCVLAAFWSTRLLPATTSAPLVALFEAGSYSLLALATNGTIFNSQWRAALGLLKGRAAQGQ